MTNRRLFLSPEELYALEQRARRERAETVARLFAQALAAAKRLIARGASALASRKRAAGEPTLHGI